MGNEVEVFEIDSDSAYGTFVDQLDTSLVYHSLTFRDFLSSICPAAIPKYLVGVHAGEIACALPLFEMTGSNGIVYNSLPFFGSNGSLLRSQHCPPALALSVWNALMDLVRSRNCLSATVMENPLDDRPLDLRGIESDFLEYRISQISYLPPLTEDADPEQVIFSQLHSKTRNIVRKAMRMDYTVGKSHTDEGLDALHELHVANMNAKGGKAKSLEQLRALYSHFAALNACDLYLSRAPNGIPAAALMVINYRNTTEYLVPGTHPAIRQDQQLSRLIFTAMVDSYRTRNMRIWNWGGTHLDQNGIRHFKSRWGSRDRIYRYLGYFGPRASELRHATREQLESEYPNFFVAPYRLLRSDGILANTPSATSIATER